MFPVDASVMVPEAARPRAQQREKARSAVKISMPFSSQKLAAPGDGRPPPDQCLTEFLDSLNQLLGYLLHQILHGLHVRLHLFDDRHRAHDDVLLRLTGEWFHHDAYSGDRVAIPVADWHDHRNRI